MRQEFERNREDFGVAHREDGEAALAYPKLDITPGEVINLWIWLEATEGRLHGEIVLVMANRKLVEDTVSYRAPTFLDALSKTCARRPARYVWLVAYIYVLTFYALAFAPCPPPSPSPIRPAPRQGP